MVRAIGVEGLRGLSWILAVAAIAAVVMGVAAVMGDAPDDVPRGDAPSLPVLTLLAWSTTAILAGAAAVLLWAVLPDKADEDDGFDWLE